MLSELRVSQLGVIEDLAIVFGPGLTALTGETGAGKTLVVEAIRAAARRAGGRHPGQAGGGGGGSRGPFRGAGRFRAPRG